MARYNLSSSMSDMSNFDEMAARCAWEKLESWPGAFSEIDIDDLALQEFDYADFRQDEVDDLEHARIRWVDEWRRVFNIMREDATPYPTQLVMIPDGFTFPTDIPDASFDDNGGKPDGDLLISPTENFTYLEIRKLIQSGARVVSGWSVVYRSPERINDVGADLYQWCGYRSSARAYALSKLVAQRIGDYCAH